jgi:uncharacterized protein (TIGR03905 family)
MHYRYKTKNVCSSEINFDLEEGKLHNVVFTGGCNGNLKAIGKLVEGMDADQVIALLKGNTCGPNFTSCADQLTKAVEAAKAEIA